MADADADADATTPAAAPRARKVLMGTCGWSDPTLLRCGKFYPTSVRTAEDRLRHYSAHFPCVEVDTSTYAIPSPANVARWVGAVAPGFVFHFKAFGLFCSKSGAASTIPGRVRGRLELGTDEGQIVRLYDLASDVRDEIWAIFNAALEPARRAGRLGVVVFQFHLSFRPSDEHRAHVEWCRRNLDARYPMAVEFRSRDWFVGDQKSRTETWLADNGMALIAADELEHETLQRDRKPVGPAHAVLPVAWPSLHPDFLYVRVHRREGTQRLLSDEELGAWEDRLGPGLPPGLKGPVYFMWGTDWEDQPLINAKRLTQRLRPEMVFDWKAIQKGSGRLESMFKAVSKAQQGGRDCAGKEEPAEGREDRECKPAMVGEETRSEDLSIPKLESSPRERVSQGADSSTGTGGNEEDVIGDAIPGVRDLSADVNDGLGIASTPGVEPSEMHSPGKVPSFGLEHGREEDSGKPRNAGGLAPAKEMSRNANAAKKARTSGSTPAITSFFKRATPSDS